MIIFKSLLNLTYLFILINCCTVNINYSESIANDVFYDESGFYDKFGFIEKSGSLEIRKNNDEKSIKDSCKKQNSGKFINSINKNDEKKYNKEKDEQRYNKEKKSKNISGNDNKEYKDRDLKETNLKGYESNFKLKNKIIHSNKTTEIIPMCHFSKPKIDNEIKTNEDPKNYPKNCSENCSKNCSKICEEVKTSGISKPDNKFKNCESFKLDQDNKPSEDLVVDKKIKSDKNLEPEISIKFDNKSLSSENNNIPFIQTIINPKDKKFEDDKYSIYRKVFDNDFYDYCLYHKESINSTDKNNFDEKKRLGISNNEKKSHDGIKFGHSQVLERSQINILQKDLKTYKNENIKINHENRERIFIDQNENTKNIYSSLTLKKILDKDSEKEASSDIDSEKVSSSDFCCGIPRISSKELLLIQKNANFYGEDVFSGPFDDEINSDEINSDEINSAEINSDDEPQQMILESEKIKESVENNSCPSMLEIENIRISKKTKNFNGSTEMVNGEMQTKFFKDQKEDTDFLNNEPELTSKNKKIKFDGQSNNSIDKKSYNSNFHEFFKLTEKDDPKEKKLINNKLINNKLINNKLINNKLINNKLINNKLINNKLINNKLINNKLINNKLINNKLINNKLINNKLINN
ncbi:hypothetical protein DMUE_3445, partial [Dictyocoela muelleri]